MRLAIKDFTGTLSRGVVRPPLLVAVLLAAVFTAGCSLTGQQTTAVAPTPVAVDTSTWTYKDGTYTATGSYRDPSGPETIGVTVTLKNNAIVDSSVQVEGVGPMSQRFQNMFAANYKTYVVGKNINEVNLTKVSGSSLTPQGFNDALSQIKQQAKV